MPIHTYECDFCGHLFEELIFRDADEDDLVCPSCGATKPTRRLSVTARVAARATTGGCGYNPPSSCPSGGG